MAKKVTVVTHDGKFHADDVFAVASILILHKDDDVKVVRSREPGDWEAADYVVDVGGEYDASRNLFDHHQPGGAGKRENGIPYASFGLVWKKFGPDICGLADIAGRIDKNFIQPIDAGDNGVDAVQPIFKDFFNFAVRNIVDLFRPTWKEGFDIDEQFLKAVEWGREVLEREVKVTCDWAEAEKIIKEQYEQSDDKRLIVFNKGDTFGREPVVLTLLLYPEPLYAVFYRPESGTWQVAAINSDPMTYKTRKPLPQKWWGLRDTELAAETGVADALFCHRTGFMCLAKSKEGALALAQKALEDKS